MLSVGACNQESLFLQLARCAAPFSIVSSCLFVPLDIRYLFIYLYMFVYIYNILASAAAAAAALLPALSCVCVCLP